MTDEVEYRCFVGNLSWSTSDRGLKAAFEKFGNLLEAKRANGLGSLLLYSPTIRVYFTPTNEPSEIILRLCSTMHSEPYSSISQLLKKNEEARSK